MRRPKHGEPKPPRGRPLTKPRSGDGALMERCRAALGASQPEFAELIGADERTVTRRQANDQRAPATAWAALYAFLCASGAAENDELLPLLLPKLTPPAAHLLGPDSAQLGRRHAETAGDPATD